MVVRKEFTLLCLSKQMVLEELLEHGSIVSDMFLQEAWENKDVVQVNKHVAVEHVSGEIVDEVLENSRHIGKAKQHNQILVMSSRGVESRLPLVPCPDANEVVSIPEIQLSKDFYSLKEF